MFRRVRLSYLFALILAAILLFLALRNVNWPEMLQTLAKTRVEFLALAVIWGTANYFVRALRWRLLITERQVNPLTVFWANMAGYLGNSYLPARSGELIRCALLGAHAGIKTSFVLATALTERIIDFGALVLIGSVAVLTLSVLPAWLHGAVGVVGAVAIAGLLGVLLAPRLEWLFRRVLERLPLNLAWRERLQGMLSQFLLGMRACQNLRRGLAFLALTVVVWTADAVGCVVVAGSMGLHFEVAQAFVLLVGLGLSSAIPSTPGAIGPYQFVAVSLLPLFGFSPSEALTYIIVLQAGTYFVITVCGLVGLARFGSIQLLRNTEQLADSQQEANEA